MTNYTFYDIISDEEINVEYEELKEEIDDKDYVKTVIVFGTKFQVFNDDYGQCYYFKYVDNSGTEQIEPCGTYNFAYLNCVIYRALSMNNKLKRARYREYK